MEWKVNKDGNNRPIYHYRKSLNKRLGAYLIFEPQRGGGLFERGSYLIFLDIKEIQPKIPWAPEPQNLDERKIGKRKREKKGDPGTQGKSKTKSKRKDTLFMFS